MHKHTGTYIQRHTKVRGCKSPFDGDWVYWTLRMGRHPQTSARVATLLKRQAGRCAYCELHFKSEDVIEQDHRLPLSRGGRDGLSNLQLLHRYCHDYKTANDKKLAKAVLMTTAN
ncbi:MAG TPA: HNH endonuclease [Chloroflexia bacterium]|nr:HNH endonuclease [Chloroflexia bacterium]